MASSSIRIMVRGQRLTTLAVIVNSNQSFMKLIAHCFHQKMLRTVLHSNTDKAHDTNRCMEYDSFNELFEIDIRE